MTAASIKPVVMTKSAALSQCVASAKSIDDEVRRRTALEGLRRHRKPSLGLRIGANLLALAIVGFGLAGCDSDDGPLEKAGKSVDQATTDVGNKIEDKCEEAKDAAGMKDTRC